MNGILNIIKPEAITSFDVIREVRKVAGEKKIGHIGTLDPFAQGMLPLFLGKWTKLIPYFNLLDKTYLVQARFGWHSDTLDREGVLEEVPIPEDFTEEKIQKALMGFLGESDQMPPAYSAVKHKGRPLYEYARKGQKVEVASRRIVIHEIDQIRVDLPELFFKVRCSKGTYIRQLVADLAEGLGTKAYLTGLTRTACGSIFTEKNSLALDRIKNMNKIDLQERSIDPVTILPDFHIVKVTQQDLLARIGNGSAVRIETEDLLRFDKTQKEGRTLVVDERDRLVSTGALEFSQGSILFQPEKVLLSIDAGS